MLLCSIAHPSLPDLVVLKLLLIVLVELLVEVL